MTSHGGSKLCVKSKGWLLYCFYCFIMAFIIVGALIYIRCITQSFYFFVVLVDLSSMIDSHVSQIMLKYHVIEISELW
jgi:type IV secretory pathway TrbF-like protein